VRTLRLPQEPIADAEAMAQVGAMLAEQLEPGDVLALHGELGAGKTTLVRGLAVALGVPAEDVSSPTFALVHRYHGRDVTLLHADLYRVEDPGELLEAGLDEQLCDPDCLVVVEWPDVARGLLPADTLHLRIAMHGQGRVLTREP
jgi:tRNA threonylcarbamoyl adenosine modification protein YjeE